MGSHVILGGLMPPLLPRYRRALDAGMEEQCES